MKTHLYRFMIAGAGILWGLISVFFKLLSAAGLDGFQTITVRFGFSAVLLLIWLAVRSPKLLRIRHPIHLLYFVGTGILSLAAFNFCYYTAIDLAGVSVAALLLYTAPAFVIVFSRLLFGETLTRRKFAALTLTIAGCACMSGALGGALAIPMTALLFGLGSGLGYALYSIFGKLALRDYAPETVTVYSFAFAALGLFPLSHPGELLPRLIEPDILLPGIGLALLCTVGAYLLYTSGLTHVDAGQASILATVEPVVAALLGFFAFRESATAAKLAGIVLILGAIVLASLPERRQ
ncbi:MAG: EamA family transporter [Butyricicoccus pullicaecorum]|nr:EamA family transporter [Butyricicoccus pullicaecorum]